MQRITQTNKFVYIPCTRRKNFGKLEEDLRDILKDPQLLAPHETGLIKESSPYVRYSQKIYRGMLPKPELKKPALSGRVGLAPKTDELQLR